MYRSWKEQVSSKNTEGRVNIIEKGEVSPDKGHSMKDIKVGWSMEFSLVAVDAILNFCSSSCQATWRHGIKFEGFVCWLKWPPSMGTMASLLCSCFLPFLLSHEGDGANDVSMIQVADIGIGISGQEGMQVSGCCAPTYHELDLPSQRQHSP